MRNAPGEMWQSILENAPNIVLVVDAEHKIKYINHTVPGLTPEQVIGMNQLDFIEPRHHDLVRKKTDEVLKTGKPSHYEIEGQGADGKVAWYSTLLGPVKDNGAIVGVALFTTDITEQKRAQEELRRTQEELLAQQARAIQELSTPVIQIWEGIVVLPLIGTIDTARAKGILDNLLEAIVETKAEVAIMDITGVSVVDTAVAGHLLETVDAARLLGTETILTGVSPSNAQTMVRLGVDVSRVVTKGSLLAGLRHAFEMTGKRVVDRE